MGWKAPDAGWEAASRWPRAAGCCSGAECSGSACSSRASSAAPAATGAVRRSAAAPSNWHQSGFFGPGSGEILALQSATGLLRPECSGRGGESPPHVGAETPRATWQWLGRGGGRHPGAALHCRRRPSAWVAVMPATPEARWRKTLARTRSPGRPPAWTGCGLRGPANSGPARRTRQCPWSPVSSAPLPGAQAFALRGPPSVARPPVECGAPRAHRQWDPQPLPAVCLGRLERRVPNAPRSARPP
mmetsp:Transcript_21159/g.66354  ORF Transcript_21159/g.66354 Transcript_21159/m.66354 type:complete len:245 (-) Transcript_21159:1141-1875(-)